jgi:hypothetical protein
MVSRPQDATTLSTATTTFPAGLDIRASPIGLSENDRPTPRPRGTGKLLSSIQGTGLALLRIEHIMAAQKGTLRLEFETENEKLEKTKWVVSPWWPYWWPRRPPENK